MSTTDLIILGMLMEKSMNAYELIRLIEERQIGKLIKISKPAVYKCCKRLSKAGCLDGEIVRESEMPEKVIYSVNRKGRDRFYRLMEHFSGNLNPFYFEFNSFLWNIGKVEKKRALEMMHNLRDQLSALKNWVVQHEREAPSGLGFAPRMIIAQYRMVLITLVAWIEETVDTYQKEQGTG